MQRKNKPSIFEIGKSILELYRVMLSFYMLRQCQFSSVVINAKSTSTGKTFEEKTDYDVLFTCDILIEDLEVLKIFVY